MKTRDPREPERGNDEQTIVEADESGRIVAAGVMAASLRICAARLDSSTDANDFVELVDELIEEVRVEARAAAKLDLEAAAKRPRKMKFMTAEHAAEIRRRASAAMNARKRLPYGWADKVAVELGYTKGQVQGAIYAKE